MIARPRQEVAWLRVDVYQLDAYNRAQEPLLRNSLLRDFFGDDREAFDSAVEVLLNENGHPIIGEAPDLFVLTKAR